MKTIDAFEAGLLDKSQACVSNYDDDSDVLLIVFSGRAGRLNITPFDFFNIVKKIPCKKLFLRDHSKSWYFRGLAGVTDSYQTTTEFLLRQIDSVGAKRVVTLGASMGGFAASFYAPLINANHVISFTPNTYMGADYPQCLDTKILNIMRLMRIFAPHIIAPMRPLWKQLPPEVFDLSTWFQHQESRMGNIVIENHFGSYFLDVSMANNVEQFAFIKQYRYDYKLHNLVTKLARSKRLYTILKRVLQDGSKLQDTCHE
jgi:hypothetical protein